MENYNITIILTSLLSLLLSVIAFFIKQLHADLRRMEQDIAEIKGSTQLIKADMRSGNDLLSQRLGYLEKRTDYFENLKA